VNVLDENSVASRRHLLQKLRIKFHQIGCDIARGGMQDEEIIPFLHRLGSVTFFTLDDDYYHRQLCHKNYCLIYLDINDNEAASFIRRLLRHPALNTEAKRMGKVIRVATERLHVWQLHAEQQEVHFWPAP
jgi:hypothetical protein